MGFLCSSLSSHRFGFPVLSDGFPVLFSVQSKVWVSCTQWLVSCALLLPESQVWVSWDLLYPELSCFSHSSDSDCFLDCLSYHCTVGSRGISSSSPCESWCSTNLSFLHSLCSRRDSFLHCKCNLNPQITFLENSQLKITSLKQEKQGYFIHSCSIHITTCFPLLLL